mmetsp:Transcript_85841/g.185346  ORF Transcript_85841/g.185346 Transcript_85841/m.185346 type:complete len:314 (+) Transcript_85841:549-1490(+)
MINKIKKEKRIRRILDRDQSATYNKMMTNAESYKTTFPSHYTKLRNRAKKFKKDKKKENWNKNLENVSNTNKVFNLVNSMQKRGTLWLDNDNITDGKSKNPTLITNKKKTVEVWRKSISEKFAGEDNSKDDSKYQNMYDEAQEIDIESEMIDLILGKCKSKSAPGYSGCNYKLIKFIWKHDKDFMTELFNDIVNDKCNIDVFSKLVIIPIFKNKKGAQTNDPNAFRMISLGETLYKIAESCFIKKNLKTIEDSSGHFQCAYKTKMGTNTAIRKLKEIMDKKKNGGIIACDLKSAFDSPTRESIYESLFENWGN